LVAIFLNDRIVH